MSVGTALIRTPDQRLRVFVSSTMQELARERGAAVEAIRNLKLTPVLFELGARPHPPRELYRAYLEQSHVFVGIYGEQYGWVAPDMNISGLEDEYLLSDRHPKLLYVKDPAPGRDERLKDLLQRIEQHDRASYKTFSSAEELGTLLANDLAVLLSERFETSRDLKQTLAAAAGEAQRGSEWRLRRWGIAVVLAAVAVSTLLGLWLNQRAARPEQQTATAGVAVPVAEATSIAVLPFVNMSPDPDQEYFSDGIAEELLNVLAQVPDLKVIARTSSFAFKGQNIDIAEIAKRLNVTHVLEGSVRKSGSQFRITAQLIRTADSTHLWSQRYDRPSDDIFAVQEEIANAIVQALQIRLKGGALSRRVGGTENLEAYQLYLRAVSAVRQGTKESLDAAEEFAEQAIQLDPNYGLAWLQLAGVVGAKLWSGYLTTEDALKRYEKYVRHAIELSPNMAEAHAALHDLYVYRDWNWAAADPEILRALALDPANPTVLSIAAKNAAIHGKFDEAERLYRTAMLHDPLDLALNDGLADIYYRTGRLAEAERLARDKLNHAPDAEWTYAFIATAQLAQGKVDAALATLQQETNAQAKTVTLPRLLHAAGRKAEAAAALRESIASWGAACAQCIAKTYAYMGDRDRAMEWLERAYRQKDTSLAGIVGEPLYADLAKDPRFQAFLRHQLNLRF